MRDALTDCESRQKQQAVERCCGSLHGSSPTPLPTTQACMSLSDTDRRQLCKRGRLDCTAECETVFEKDAES